MSRPRSTHLNPVPFGTGILLVPDFVSPLRDERIVKPTRRKGIRNA
jgi:hypothetical protein